MPHRRKPKCAETVVAPPGLRLASDIDVVELEARISMLERIYLLVDWMAIEKVLSSGSALEKIALVPKTDRTVTGKKAEYFKDSERHRCEFFDIGNDIDLMEGASQEVARVQESLAKEISFDYAIEKMSNHLLQTPEVSHELQCDAERKSVAGNVDTQRSIDDALKPDCNFFDKSSNMTRIGLMHILEKCEKCDGGHATEFCPHFKLERGVIPEYVKRNCKQTSCIEAIDGSSGDLHLNSVCLFYNLSSQSGSSHEALEIRQ